MIEKILGTIKKHNLIENGDRIILGISGGPDSICLLHALHSLRTDLNISLFAVHINHMLRGREADMDQEYVRKFCMEREIQLFERSVDVRNAAASKGISLEEAGRDARYQVFESIAEITGAGKIAVAHNKNDQAETILMHMIRGTGLDGLKGIDYRRGSIIRPLLDIARSEIEEYCSQNGLNPRIDSSNLEAIYTRNKIRIDLIPYINRLFDINISENLVRMASLVREDRFFIEEFARKAYDYCSLKTGKNEISIDLKKLAGYDPSIKKRVLRNGIRELRGTIKGIESVHIENAARLAISGRTGSKLHLPGGLRIEKSYDILKLKTENGELLPRKFSYRVAAPGSTFICERGAHMEAFLVDPDECRTESKSVKTDGFVQFFDYETLTEGIYIRNRENGDVFKPLKSNGKRKLKEYFIDCKIPRDLRDSIPLVAAGNEIVWIIGFKISDKFKVTENTKCVLKLQYKAN